MKRTHSSFYHLTAQVGKGAAPNLLIAWVALAKELLWRAPVSGISFPWSEPAALHTASQAAFNQSVFCQREKNRVFKELLADVGAEGDGGWFGEGLFCVRKSALNPWDVCGF